MGSQGAHDHDASAVDVEGELARTSRGLGLSLVVVGALFCSGGLWLFTRSSVYQQHESAPASELEARRERARALVREGRPGAAADLCAQILEDSPGDVETLLCLAEARLAGGDSVGARSALGEARGQAGDSAELRDLELAVERAETERGSGFSPPQR